MSDNYALYFVDPKLTHVLEDDYTIQDLIYLVRLSCFIFVYIKMVQYSWTREKPLQLLFTLARLSTEEDSPPVLERLDMEMMPQLRPESPQLKGSPTSPMANSPTQHPHNIPNFSVCLSSSAFESGSVHPPIITECSSPSGSSLANNIGQQQQLQSMPKKKRKSSALTKKSNDERGGQSADTITVKHFLFLYF